MEKKTNLKLLIIVGVLLVIGIGATFSYYVAETLLSGTGGKVDATTATVKNTTFTVEGKLNFNDLDIYPGHKNISKIKVTAKNNTQVINYNLIWNGINNLSTPLKYYVYESDTDETPSITCTKKNEYQGATKIYYEECVNNNFDNIGSIVSSGIITNSNETRKIVLKENETITSSGEGTVRYYYVVLEFPNEDVLQNNDINKTFDGVVTVEEYKGNTLCGTHNVNTVLGTLAVNDCTPEFRVSAPTPIVNEIIASSKIADLTNIENDATYPFTYDEVNGTFTSTNKTNGTTSTITLNTANNVESVGLCYEKLGNGNAIFYKDDEEIGSISGNVNNCIELNNITPENKIKVQYVKPRLVMTASKDEVIFYLSNDFEVKQTGGEGSGIYEAPDGMYGGTSYYWRGAVTNNYVQFGKHSDTNSDTTKAGKPMYWRIVRINGDGSLRLIYDGTTPHENGTSTADNLAIENVAFNENWDHSEYVGYTYKAGYQRSSDTTEGAEENSTIKTALEDWYLENIEKAGYDGKVSVGKYCNDRNVDAAPANFGSEYVTTWSTNGSPFAYSGLKRLYEDYKPTLNCNNRNDVYNLKIGLITADEVELAGGGPYTNQSYYLYNGQGYWTFSPRRWSGGNAFAFGVGSDGLLLGYGVSDGRGARPVINLSSENLKISGEGTILSPYVLS